MRNRTLRRLAAVATMAAMTLGLTVVLPALADAGHGAPDCTSLSIVNEPAFGSRDGVDKFHLTRAAVPNSLADLSGHINVCRTNDSTVVEAAGGSVSVERIDFVNRALIRPQLRRWNGTAMVIVSNGPAVNTGINRTLTVTTPTLTEPGVGNPDTDTLVPGWYDVNLRALLRFSGGSTQFYIQHTYPIWLGDGPVTLPIPS